MNFMETNDTDSQALLGNLIAYLAAPTPIAPSSPPPVVNSAPTLSTGAMVLLACVLTALAGWNLRRPGQGMPRVSTGPDGIAAPVDAQVNSLADANAADTARDPGTSRSA